MIVIQKKSRSVCCVSINGGAKVEEFLYRYISFESFVGLVQKKALTFVLPELWDDPKEGAAFFELLKTIDDEVKKIILFSVYNKTYGQCWTRLSESDAMWRIYSNHNRAIQIKVSVENLKKLPDVQVVPVVYSDDFKIKDDETGIDSFLQSLAMKRIAFQHENEVRLIRHYKFNNTEDAEYHYKAFYAVSNNSDSLNVLNSLYPNISIEEKVKKVAHLLNVGNDRVETIEVPFDHLSGFIECVKVHPMAPDWYVDIVEEYCKRNEVPFLGKSALYLKKEV